MTTVGTERGRKVLWDPPSLSWRVETPQVLLTALQNLVSTESELFELVRVLKNANIVVRRHDENYERNSSRETLREWHLASRKGFSSEAKRMMAPVLSKARASPTLRTLTFFSRLP